MVINTNLNAMNAYRSMGIASTKQGLAMEKLSSGNRISRAADDAAGLAISEKMRSQINGLVQASRNAQDGVSMIQTAEGALSETQAISQRMKELAVQSANGIYTKEDRKLINQEFTQLKEEIDRIAEDTEFNGSKLLNGDRSGKSIDVAAGTGNTNNGKNAGKWIFRDNNAIKVTGDKVTEANMQKTFANTTTQEELKKLGEGTFQLRVFVGEAAKTNMKDTPFEGLKDEHIKIQLIDMSKFNGNKEYVMDEIVVQKGENRNIELYGVNFKLTDNDGLVALAKEKGKAGAYEFTHKLDDSKKTDGTKLQVGASGDQSIGFDIDFMRARELGLGGVEIGTLDKAKSAITSVDEAIKRVSSQRASLGATQNRLEHTIASNDNTAENLQASESRIRDVDMAKEMMNLTKLNILQQASQAMLFQANQAPNQVLSMLR